jgi:hypothetical protein
MEKPGSLDALASLNEAEAERRKAYPEAIRAFEEACNTIALIFPHNSPQRRIAITARGDMREANGEART